MTWIITGLSALLRSWATDGVADVGINKELKENNTSK